VKDKVQAIYDLREAAEQHARAAIRVERNNTPEARDELLEARIRLENQTHDAIVACHQCGRPHAPDDRCSVIPFRGRF
jgi:hypothetical protein